MWNFGIVCYCDYSEIKLNFGFGLTNRKKNFINRISCSQLQNSIWNCRSRYRIKGKINKNWLIRLIPMQICFHRVCVRKAINNVIDWQFMWWQLEHRDRWIWASEKFPMQFGWAVQAFDWPSPTRFPFHTNRYTIWNVWEKKSNWWH